MRNNCVRCYNRLAILLQLASPARPYLPRVQPGYMLQMPNEKGCHRSDADCAACCDSGWYQWRPPMGGQRGGSTCESKETVDLDPQHGEKKTMRPLGKRRTRYLTLPFRAFMNSNVLGQSLDLFASLPTGAQIFYHSARLL